MKLFLKVSLYVLFAVLIGVQAILFYRAYQLAIHSPILPVVSNGRLPLLKTIIGLVKLKTFSAIGFAILLVLLFNFEKLYNYFAYSLSLIISWFLSRIKQSVHGGFLPILIIPVGLSVYYAITMPVSYDEAWTFNAFSSKGVWNSISYYPLPNNHILYSVLTNISVFLPLSSTLAIRIPALLINVLCIFFLFNFIKDYYNKHIALISSAAFSVLYMAIYYSYMARGYSLECLFFILLSYTVFKIVNQPEIKRYWAYYVVANALGFFTMPSFLYPFIIANLFILIFCKKITPLHFISNVSVVLITWLLYLPALSRSGLQNIINNRFVKPLSRPEVIKRIPQFFYQAVADITGWSAIVVIVLILAAVIVLFRRYRGAARYYFPFVMLCCPILLVVHSVIPFSRTFEYCTCIFALFIGIVIFELFRSSQHYLDKYIWVLILSMQVFMAINFNTNIYRDEEYAIIARNEIKQLGSGNSFFVLSSLFGTYLTFYDGKDKNFVIYDWVATPPVAINLDSIGDRHYDFYIVDNDMDSTQRKIRVIKTSFNTVYK